MRKKLTHVRRCSQDISRLFVVGIILCFCLMGGVGMDAETAAASSCLSETGESAVAACRRELNRDPHDLDVRLALGNALMQLQRYEEAVNVLREGLALSPGSAILKEKLTLSESYLAEQRLIRERRKRERESTQGAGRPKLDIHMKRILIRCTKLKGDAALKACNEGLKTLPEEPSLHWGKADALLDMNRVGEAILSYRESLRLKPSDAKIVGKLEAAQSKRAYHVGRCLKLAGAAGLEACGKAFMAGEPDAFAIQARKGDLLRQMNRGEEAIQAYQAARQLDPGNAAVKQKLAMLMKPTPKPRVAPAPTSKPIAKIPPPATQRKPIVRETPKPIKETPAPKAADVVEEKRPVQVTERKRPVPLPPTPEAEKQPPPRILYSNRPATPGITY